MASTKKPNKNFKNLKDLIFALRAEELTLAKKHLTAFESYNTKEPSKMLRLFKTIHKNPDIEEDRVKKRIAKGINDKSFNQLLRRTNDRIQESLILDINLNRPKSYSPIFQKRFKIRKLLVQAAIIQGRGLNDQMLKIYNWIIRTAKTYELYDELIETLYLKQGVLVYREGKNTYEKLGKEINFYEDTRNRLRDVKEFYRSYFAEVSFKGKIENKSNYLGNALSEIENHEITTGSSNISMYKNLLTVEFANITEDNELAINTCLKSIELLKNNLSVYSAPRIAIHYFMIAENEIIGLKFKEAIKYSRLSEKNSTNRQTVNFIINLNYRLISNIYLQDYKSALATIEEIENVKSLESFPFYKGRLFYQKALVFFGMEKYRDASLLLNNLEELEKDKEGWNLWIRIMRILCSIELLKLNLIDYDVESFRKYIQRLNRSRDVRNRDKLVLKILLELDRCDYDFEEVSQKQENTLSQLNSTEKDIKWQPNSPELILFHDWFAAKLNNNSYQPKFDLYRMKNSKKKPIKREQLKSKENYNHQGQLAIEF